MDNKYSISGNQVRKTFIDYFVDHGHTFVPSASLVPGSDQTLLFTNAGMVQFKDVFLGIDKRPYSRAVDSQKCMRVAGKHNDLDDVGRDDSHHTFFEMLGNWSFGDYYKKEAITWAWELLTEVWGLPKERLWATCFRDDKGNIAEDMEAAENWRQQPGIDPSHVIFFGRKDNFWEMAETGPCGPCSEIHFDRGPQYCDLQGQIHNCSVNGDCKRFLELWNLVFIQYNRLGVDNLEPLPATHVDTGMGFDRIVSVLQGVDSNYRTDLLWPLIIATQLLTGQSDSEREANFTPYRVIADHARAAAFLIADGVVPGNTGRNYITRMIIRRAARFANKIGLTEPFLAKVAEEVINIYGDFYPELVRNRSTILANLTREEYRFQRTVEGGVAKLDNLLNKLRELDAIILPGEQAFDLYATFGLPLEITRDIAREQGLDVDEPGFRAAMEGHREASGAGEAFGEMGGKDVDIYAPLFSDLQSKSLLGSNGVAYDPYMHLEIEGNILALVVDGESVASAHPGEKVGVILPRTCFYIESGGQMSDTGKIITSPPPPLLSKGWGEGQESWEIRISGMQKPATGIIVHLGEVIHGEPKVGDVSMAQVDVHHRFDIQRNHTATHLLHAELRSVLGEHARQAGSLVASDRLRFDFTHPEAITPEQLAQIEAGVNRRILENHRLNITFKPLQQAIGEGATALFGEKYGEIVRNITIGDDSSNNLPGKTGKIPFSNELCGGTHVSETGDIGIFLITSEGSVASGIRRIEAVTGRSAYDLIQHRFSAMRSTAELFSSSMDEIPQKVRLLLEELNGARKQLSGLRQELVAAEFSRILDNTNSFKQPSENFSSDVDDNKSSFLSIISGIPLLTATLPDANSDTLRQMSDRFRQRYPSGIAVLASIIDGRPLLVISMSEDLVKRGLHAGELAKYLAAPLGGSGGGRPTLAQAGGKDASHLENALMSANQWIRSKIK